MLETVRKGFHVLEMDALFSLYTCASIVLKIKGLDIYFYINGNNTKNRPTTHTEWTFFLKLRQMPSQLYI